jgi:uncharacterized membrane protein YphA (DoxX/SURF4 family)
MERAGLLYGRLALGAAFLSAVAARFGLWDGTISLEHFARFTRYTAEVNSFMPAATAPFLAWCATVAELTLGIALVAGFRLRLAAIGAAGLLALFGAAMAMSFGFKEPLDYSVFSASAAALLIAAHPGSRSASRVGHAPRLSPWWARRQRLVRGDGVVTE